MLVEIIINCFFGKTWTMLAGGDSEVVAEKEKESLFPPQSLSSDFIQTYKPLPPILPRPLKSSCRELLYIFVPSVSSHWHDVSSHTNALFSR
jgi:hypothetical protein